METNNCLLFLGDVVPFKPISFKNNFRIVCNLECPITKKGKPAESKINLLVKENYLKKIFKDHIFALCLSNNHILDFGIEGLESTLEEINKEKISYFGLNNFNSFSPLTTTLNSNKIAFLAVVCESTTPVTKINNIEYLTLLNTEVILDKIQKLKETFYRIILYVHWGVEESSYPQKVEIEIARKLIDGGVDILIGSHAHSPQAIEKYKNGIIAYNLGNFIMPTLKAIPSYYNQHGIPLSSYTKRAMLWNRISWGLLIDIQTMKFKIFKYLHIFDRIIKLPLTPFDKYLNIKSPMFSNDFEILMKKHVRRRFFYRKLFEFLFNPHFPQKIKKLL